jgi:hypothetical protein
MPITKHRERERERERNNKRADTKNLPNLGWRRTGKRKQKGKDILDMRKE